MSSALTIKETTIPVAWDAKIMLEFIENPAFETLNQWIDTELAQLEAKWEHTSSPKAWNGQSIRGSRVNR
jgi:hypothetical protein